MTEKRAFLVMGPESSGTRLMTQLLIAAGCDGDGDHWQRWDEETPEAPLIVFRRHTPANRTPPWADDNDVIRGLQDLGYTVHVVLITRDWHSTIISQVEAPHAASVEEAIEKIRNAWRRIFANLQPDVDFDVVSYESLVMRPAGTVRFLFQRLGLPAPDPMPRIYDGNEKYYPALEAAVV